MVEKIANFRQLLSEFFDEHPDAWYVIEAKQNDVFCMKFIKARDNLADSVIMFKHAVKFREDFGCDKCNDWRFPNFDAIKSIYRHYYHGFDKYGRPVYIDESGRMNIRDLMQVAEYNQVLKIHVASCEFFQGVLVPRSGDRSEQAGLGFRQYQSTNIIDANGVGIGSLIGEARKFLGEISKIDQDTYPESMGVTFVINTSWLFSAIWSMIKPWLNERTQRKIIVLRGRRAWEPNSKSHRRKRTPRPPRWYVRI
eukprot:GABV01000957.1.p1 GENE.GABV01000957.1~~GABV01000957.1.p1  ORF type:complete len:279 (+),score=71.39 GABV01000957.1:79-837(+)